MLKQAELIQKYLLFTFKLNFKFHLSDVHGNPSEKVKFHCFYQYQGLEFSVSDHGAG